MCKVNPEKSIQIGWEGGKSSVEVSFYPKGAAKSQVTVQHSKLDNAVDAETMKAYWGAALARLQEYLQAAE